MGYERPYERMVVWQRSDEYLKLVYRATKDFPSEERFGIVSQWRRAALSIVLNIVEGLARSTKKDKARFLLISRGSLAECTYLGDISRALGYLSVEQYNEIEQVRGRASFLLQRTIDSFRNS